jgi:hypothetical protein
MVLVNVGALAPRRPLYPESLGHSFSGATAMAIAELERISRTLASRVRNSPECRQLVVEFVSDEHNEMRALFYRSLHTIEHALSATREYMTKEGLVIYGGRTTTPVSRRRNTCVIS